MSNNSEHTCCICGKKFVGWENNPWPVNNDEEACCCEECNFAKVLPARLKLWRETENQ